MSHRISRAFALTTVSAALTLGGLGATSAVADRGHPEDGPHHGHHHCKGLEGKKKRNCEAHHHHRHGAENGSGLY